MSVVSMDPRLQARRIEVLRLRGRRRLKLVLVVVIGALIAGLTWWTVMQSPWLDVDTVTVNGAERTAVVDVIEVAGITIGQPLVEVEARAAESAVASLPWVDTVSTSTSLSGEVAFVLTERVAVAAVPGPEGWLVVDAEGRVLERRASVPSDVAVIEGRGWNAQPGGWIGEAAMPALDVAALLPSNLGANVASIHDDEGGLRLVLFGGGVVELGHATDLDRKFLSALTVLMRVDQRCVDRIDVRAPSVPVLTRLDGCPYPG